MTNTRKAVTTWSAEELDRIASAQELQIAPRRPDGTLRSYVTIWVVRVGDDLYVRSWRGPAASWFRAVQATHEARIRAGGVEKDVALVDAGDRVDEDVDGVYRSKYAGYGAGYVGPMTEPPARDTTLRLVPQL